MVILDPFLKKAKFSVSGGLQAKIGSRLNHIAK